MGHPLRWFVPGVVYEITTRTIQERFLLRPSDEVRDRVTGIIARAAKMFDVTVYGYVFLSNHGQILASATDGNAMASFMGYVNGNIARVVGWLHGWRGPFWGRRARPIPIVDDVALVARLRYLMVQGVKEGLVHSPLEWPGPSSVPAMMTTMRVRGTWVDRDGLRAARRRGGSASAAEFTTHPELELAPLPCWASLGRDELMAKHRELLEEVVAEGRGRRVLGVAKVLRQPVTQRPAEPACSPAPACHTVSSVLRERFAEMRRGFTEAFRAAARRFRKRWQDPAAANGARAAGFPPGSYPLAGHVAATRDVLNDLMVGIAV